MGASCGRLVTPNDIRRPVAEVDGCQNGRRNRPRAWKEPSVRNNVRAQHLAHRACSPSPLRVIWNQCRGEFRRKKVPETDRPQSPPLLGRFFWSSSLLRRDALICRA
jgi:hypothetical protein